MGVPTITYAGANYVSRMSTAVLSGAAMFDWIAHNHDDYVRLASEHALRINELRQNRGNWRTQLQNSPLGDSRDLMDQLERQFSLLHNEALSRV